MITNERQYRITKSQAEKFRNAIEGFDKLALIRDGIDPVIASVQLEGLKSQLEDLEASLQHFEALRTRNIREFVSSSFLDFGSSLIEARIASGLTQKDLAKKLGMKEQQIQRYEQGGYKTASIARVADVVAALDVSTKITLSLIDQTGDGDKAEKPNPNNPKLPHREMRKRGWLDDLQIKSQEPSLSDEMLAVVYVQQANPAQMHNALHKQTVRLGGHYDEGALLAWKSRILQLARGVNLTPDYGVISDSSFLKELASQSRYADGPVRAVKMLSDVGVTVVVERHVAKTHLDGAAMLLDGKRPVIGLTLRHDRLDNFWFVLLHELGHIACHRNKGLDAGFFDNDKADAIADIEREADKFARSVLIPDEIWRSSFVRFASSPDKVVAFADQIGVSPAIVAGRIRRERGDYSIFSDLVGRNKLRDMLSKESSVVGGYHAA